MGRKRTHLKLSTAERAEIRRLFHNAKDKRGRERLQVARWAATGRYTLEDLARLSGRVRATIQNWLEKFHSGGVGGLLARDTPPGAVSPIAAAGIQDQLRAGWKSGRWRSASQVAAWLKETHGVTRARKSVYYWLGKCGCQPLRTKGQGNPSKSRSRRCSSPGTKPDH